MVCSIVFWTLGISKGNNQSICCWKRTPTLLWELLSENEFDDHVTRKTKK
jgi:hypothetical protein